MSDLVQLRKIVMYFEEIYHEGGTPPPKSVVRAAILAIVANPYAGRYVEDLSPYTEALLPLAGDLAARLVDALGNEPEVIEGFGAGAIVGSAGEVEHGALWSLPASQALGTTLAQARAPVPAAAKVGVIGARLDLPLGNVLAALVQSHQDALDIGVPDAPRPDEIAFALAMTTGGRIHARSGGLQISDVRGEDGLR
jgi:hypothetical protein